MANHNHNWVTGDDDDVMRWSLPASTLTAHPNSQLSNPNHPQWSTDFVPDGRPAVHSRNPPENAIPQPLLNGSGYQHGGRPFPQSDEGRFPLLPQEALSWLNYLQQYENTGNTPPTPSASSNTAQPKGQVSPQQHRKTPASPAMPQQAAKKVPKRVIPQLRESKRKGCKERREPVYRVEKMARRYLKRFDSGPDRREDLIWFHGQLIKFGLKCDKAIRREYRERELRISQEAESEGSEVNDAEIHNPVPSRQDRRRRTTKAGRDRSGMEVENHELPADRNGSSSLSCPKCRRVFARPGDLNRHVKIHRRAGEWNCCRCGKVLTRKHHLRTHMKTQHADSLTSDFIERYLDLQAWQNKEPARSTHVASQDRRTSRSTDSTIPVQPVLARPSRGARRKPKDVARDGTGENEDTDTEPESDSESSLGFSSDSSDDSDDNDGVGGSGGLGNNPTQASPVAKFGGSHSGLSGGSSTASGASQGELEFIGRRLLASLFALSGSRDQLPLALSRSSTGLGCLLAPTLRFTLLIPLLISSPALSFLVMCSGTNPRALRRRFHWVGLQQIGTNLLGSPGRHPLLQEQSHGIISGSLSGDVSPRHILEAPASTLNASASPQRIYSDLAHLDHPSKFFPIKIYDHYREMYFHLQATVDDGLALNILTQQGQQKVRAFGFGFQDQHNKDVMRVVSDSYGNLYTLKGVIEIHACQPDSAKFYREPFHLVQLGPHGSIREPDVILGRGSQLFNDFHDEVEEVEEPWLELERMQFDGLENQRIAPLDEEWFDAGPRLEELDSQASTISSEMSSILESTGPKRLTFLPYSEKGLRAIRKAVMEWPALEKWLSEPVDATYWTKLSARKLFMLSDRITSSEDEQDKEQQPGPVTTFEGGNGILECYDIPDPRCDEHPIPRELDCCGIGSWCYCHSKENSPTRISLDWLDLRTLNFL